MLTRPTITPFVPENHPRGQRLGQHLGQRPAPTALALGPVMALAVVLVAVLVLVLVVEGRADADEAARRIDLPTLQRLAKSSPKADMARQRTLVARSKISEVRSNLFPKITVEAGVQPSPDIMCLDPDCTRTDPTDGITGYGGVAGSAQVSLVQPLYGFGRSGPIGRAVQAGARATSLLEGAVAGDLAVEAAQAYYGLKLARELSWMLEDGLAETDKALEGIADALEEGTGDATVQDRLRILTLQAELRARISEAAQAQAVALAGIRALAGDPAVDIDDQPLAAVDVELANQTEYRERAAEQRPEISAARAGAEAAHALQAFESAQQRPVLYLFADYQFSRANGIDEPPSWFADDPYNRHRLAFGVRMRWQFDYAGQRAKINSARAQAGQAEALVRAAQVLTGFEVEKAFAEAAQAKARMEATREGEKAGRAWVASVLQASALGTVESKDLADAMLGYFTVRSRYLTSVYEWNLATVRLQRATGSATSAE